MQIGFNGPLMGQSVVCAAVLEALPEWFGIPESTAQYIQDIAQMPTIIAQDRAQVVGFLALRLHNAYAAEIHVMGVLPEYHRRGVGRELVIRAEHYLQERGFKYLHVKTLSPAHPDAGYARTRQFYLAVGFCPLEEFNTLWGEANPCLQMIKWIGKEATE